VRQAVVRSALIFGLIVAALRGLQQGAGIFIALSAADQSTDPGTVDGQLPTLLLLVGLAGIILFFVNLGLYLLAGMFAARQTGSVGSGSVAGMLAGALAGVVGAAITIGTYATGLQLPGLTGSTPIPPEQYQFFIIVVAVGAVMGVAFDIGYGAGLGALGGLIGRSSYERTHPIPPPMPGIYAPPWVYAPGAYPTPGYGAPSPYSPYMPYSATQPPQLPNEPWPAAYPPPLGYLPPPPPEPAGAASTTDKTAE
jgi:hypothetical protein